MKHACVPLDSNSSLRDGSLDDIYNWIASFFRDDSHITKYGNEVSELRTISVSIIQGSGIGPPSYVVTASDTLGRVRQRYVKICGWHYLIIPADNLQSCQEEIANVDSWANHNNLKLNHAKSAEIIFVRPRSKRAVQIPTRNISGFVRVELTCDNQSKIFCCKACRSAADLMCILHFAHCDSTACLLKHFELYYYYYY